MITHFIYYGHLRKHFSVIFVVLGIFIAPVLILVLRKIFLNQARAAARTWFLEITFIPPVYVCVCVCVCVCVHPRGYK